MTAKALKTVSVARALTSVLREKYDDFKTSDKSNFKGRVSIPTPFEMGKQRVHQPMFRPLGGVNVLPLQQYRMSDAPGQLVQCATKALRRFFVCVAACQAPQNNSEPTSPLSQSQAHVAGLQNEIGQLEQKLQVFERHVLELDKHNQKNRISMEDVSELRRCADDLDNNQYWTDVVVMFLKCIGVAGGFATICVVLGLCSSSGVDVSGILSWTAIATGFGWDCFNGRKETLITERVRSIFQRSNTLLSEFVWIITLVGARVAKSLILENIDKEESCQLLSKLLDACSEANITDTKGCINLLNVSVDIISSLTAKSENNPRDNSFQTIKDTVKKILETEQNRFMDLIYSQLKTVLKDPGTIFAGMMFVYNNWHKIEEIFGVIRLVSGATTTKTFSDTSEETSGEFYNENDNTADDKTDEHAGKTTASARKVLKDIIKTEADEKAEQMATTATSRRAVKDKAKTEATETAERVGTMASSRQVLKDVTKTAADETAEQMGTTAASSRQVVKDVNKTAAAETAEQFGKKASSSRQVVKDTTRTATADTAEQMARKAATSRQVVKDITETTAAETAEHVRKTAASSRQVVKDTTKTAGAKAGEQGGSTSKLVEKALGKSDSGGSHFKMKCLDGLTLLVETYGIYQDGQELLGAFDSFLNGSKSDFAKGLRLVAKILERFAH